MRRYVFLVLVLMMIGVAVYVSYGAHAVPAKRVEQFSTASTSTIGGNTVKHVPACSGRVVLEFLNDQKEVVFTRSWPLAVWYVPNGPVFRYVRLRVSVHCSDGAMPDVSGTLQIRKGNSVLINAPLHAVGNDYETIADMELINANAGSVGEYEAVAHVTVKVGGDVVADKTVSVRVYGKPTHERVRPRPVRLIRYELGPWLCCSGCCDGAWAPARVVRVYALYSDGSVHAVLSEMVCHDTDRVFHVVGVEGSLHVHVGSPPPDTVAKCRAMNSEYPVTKG